MPDRRGITVRRSVIFLSIFAILFSAALVLPCTNILVSKGASKDGSVMITYSADGSFMPRLILLPARTYKDGEMEDVVGWEDTEIRGQIKSIGYSYKVVGLMNEHQVAIGETTTGGRRELVNREGLFDYDGLIIIALKRAKTAREAIMVMDQMVNEYGYASSGESFSIADKNEVWFMEIIGKGPGVKGANWVAARVPDGSISAHANQARIQDFPMNDPENWLYSKDIVQFATEKGFYDPKSGKPFSFRDAFHPNISASTKRVCAGRVWSIYRHSAPSANFSPDYFRGVEGCEDYPLFIKPDAPLARTDVMNMMRDHFEGTPYDMTQGIDAGAFGSPYRWRGLSFEIDGKKYSWERPISTMQAGFVMLAQCRSWLPDPVGGVYWYTPDDANVSVFLPLYSGIETLPAAYTTGDFGRLSFDSAWWVFNIVGNFTYDRYSVVFPDVLAERNKQEQFFEGMLPMVDKTAAAMAVENPDLAKRYLTQFSVSAGEQLFRDWRELLVLTFTKHLDLYQHEGDTVKMNPYPVEWLKKVIAERGDVLALP